MSCNENTSGDLVEKLGSMSLETRHNESVSLLSAMFPNVTLKDIKESLEECLYDFDRACDLLLNYEAINIDKDFQKRTEGNEEEGNATGIELARSTTSSTKILDNKVRKHADHGSVFPEEFEKEGFFLRELFPNVAPVEILRLLKAEDMNVGVVYDILMNYSFINDKGKSTKKAMDLSSKEKEVHRQNKTWEQVNEEIEKIESLTGASKTKSQYFYHKTGSIFSAIISIVRNEPSASHKEMNVQNDKEIYSTAMAMSSNRDQISPGQQSQLKSPPSTPSLPSEQIRDISGTETTFDSTLFKQELESYKLEDPSLFLVSDAFYNELSMYFKNDVEKALAVARFLIEEEQHAITYSNLRSSEKRTMTGTIEGPPSKVMTNTESKRPSKRISLKEGKKGLTALKLVEESRNYTQLARDSSDANIKNHYLGLASQSKAIAFELEKTQQSAAKTNKVNESLRTNKLDLHNLSVEAALDALRSVVSEWWKEEQAERELSGRVTRYGKARQVVPLTVITGRGVHSKGGISKLKIAVKKYLLANAYLFDEGTSSYVILGKKYK